MFFFARNAGSEQAIEGEQINALGNHLGSYNINYSYKFDTGQLQLYHQHLFEDGSGTAFKNFPDGVWGIYLKQENSWLKSVLYEFAYTLDQSGARGVSGRDSYFSSAFYSSGWRYKNRVIGLPFIEPDSNNRIRAHHLGATAAFRKISVLLKTSYVEGLGTYQVPIKPNLQSVYTYGNLTYITDNYGNLSLYSGFDILNRGEDNFGLGLSYHYSF